MPQTPTETSIRQSRRARGVLVPLLEELMRFPIEIDDGEDIEFLNHLVKARARPRKKGIYSPSMLASCVRQVYFVKTGQTRKNAPNKRASGYFLDGNFRHFKWQFALWKLHRAGKINLIGCEVFVINKKGDYGGTIDALIEIDGVFYIVDFKGMNSHSFMKYVGSGTPINYRVQIVGYAMIANTSVEFDGKIQKCILVGENKSGPIQRGSPIGLHEDIIQVAKYRREIKARLSTLREYETNEEVPPAECTSTSSLDFQGCAFCWFCRGEVERIEKREKAKSRNTAKPRPRVSSRSRTNRTRRIKR